MFSVKTLLPIALLLLACGGPAVPEDSEAAGWGADVQSDEGFEEAASGLASSCDFLIKRGKHDSTKGGPRSLKLNTRVNRRLSFRVMFPAGNDYTTSNPANQSDFNKVMGITTNRIHDNSLRLGWAWNPATRLMDLGFYAYVDGNRTMRVLKSVPLGQWTSVEMTMTNDAVTVRADEAYFEVRSSLGLSKVIPTMTWVLATAYFGGDETAPKDLTVKVDGISHD